MKIRRIKKKCGEKRTCGRRTSAQAVMIPQATLLRIVREVVVPPPLLSLRSALVLAQQWPAALASKGDPPLPHLAVQPAAKAALLPPAPPMISSAMAAATSLRTASLSSGSSGGGATLAVPAAPCRTWSSPQPQNRACHCAARCVFPAAISRCARTPPRHARGGS